MSVHNWTVAVLVPNPGTRAAEIIDAGSGVVTADYPTLAGVAITVYFEGGRYSALSYTDKVATAAGRCVEMYPTIARARLAAADFTRVGSYDVATRQLVIEDPNRVADWLQGEA
jgi:hypothetical protein